MSAGRVAVAFDMTFPRRAGSRQSGTGVYARSLVDALRLRGDVAIAEVAGPDSSGALATAGWLLLAAPRVLSATRCDILHCPAFIAPPISPVPTVITIHDAGALLHPGDFPREWRLYNRYVLPAVARRAQAIMTGTETARQDLVRHLGLREAQIVVAPYGVDDIYRRPVDPCRVAVWRKRLGDPPVLLFSGAPSPRKNLDAVLRILRDAAPGNALGQARLAISGASESAFPLYSRWLSERGLQDRVQWLGTVSRDDMPGLYAAVDALVYPSLYEGFGLPPLEAMSVGTPVIASRVSCLPEVLGDGALLVDPVNHRELGEAVRVVLEEPTVRHDILERGHKRAGQYTWESCAARTASVYRRIAGDA